MSPGQIQNCMAKVKFTVLLNTLKTSVFSLTLKN